MNIENKKLFYSCGSNFSLHNMQYPSDANSSQYPDQQSIGTDSQPLGQVLFGGHSPEKRKEGFVM
jgi:hypothetical protein